MTDNPNHKLIAFTMPKWGIEMSEGTIGEWMVGEGDSVQRGQLITAVETDKISNEVEAEWDGVLLRRLAEEGETVVVGALVAVFGPAETPAEAVDEFIATFKPADTAFEPVDSPVAEEKPAALPEKQSSAAAVPAPEPKHIVPDDAIISPRARALAEAQGVDVSGVKGSGRKSRITLQDIEQQIRPARSGRRKGVLDLPPVDKVAHATPLALREAARLGVDIGKITGSGKGGKLRRVDILAQAPASADNGHDVIKYSAMRRTVAKRLVEAVNTIPHFYLRTQADVDWLLNVREKINADRGLKLSINDFILKAVANALVAVPDCNVHVFDNEIHRFRHADISLAVSVEGGLITPVIRSADQKSVEEISAEARELADRARAGKLMPEDYKGGTFSLSNLGMYGITSFDAVINPPQGGILAVGAARRVPVERDYALAFVSQIDLTMSCDHRAIDGALGARFLAAVKQGLEHPADLVEGM